MVNEETTEQTEQQEPEQSFEEKAMQRLKDQGDTRVPSDPSNFKPADIPPKPLTRAGYSETE
jgi:hypothetical protein